MLMSSNARGFVAAVLALYKYLSSAGLRSVGEVKLSSVFEEYVFREVSLNGDIMRFKFSDKSYIAKFHGCEVELNAIDYEVSRVVEEVPRDLFIVKSSVGGRVIKLFVSEGAKVVKGETLLKIESMKMEVEVKSPVNGVVERILISEGSDVKVGAPIMAIRIGG